MLVLVLTGTSNSVPDAVRLAPGLCVCCPQADALEFYTGALQQQLRELQQLQRQVRHQLPRPAAFVTFRCTTRSSCCLTFVHDMLQTSRGGHWQSVDDVHPCWWSSWPITTASRPQPLPIATSSRPQPLLAVVSVLMPLHQLGVASRSRLLSCAASAPALAPAPASAVCGAYGGDATCMTCAAWVCTCMRCHCRSQLTATLACSSLHSYDEAAWSIGPAPQPQEVEWGPLGVRTWELVLR